VPRLSAVPLCASTLAAVPHHAERPLTASTRKIGIENYVRTLLAALLGYYLEHDYCWVVSGLRRQTVPCPTPPRCRSRRPTTERWHASVRVVYRASPYRRGEGPVAFSFDWSFDYYRGPTSAPGPEMTVYRLSGGRCGP